MDTSTVYNASLDPDSTQNPLWGYAGFEFNFSLVANHPLFKAAVVLYRVAVIVIIIVGVIANSLILVLQHRLDREGGGSGLSLLMSGLAVSDSIMLLVSGLPFFTAFTFHTSMADVHDVSCKLVYLLTYVTGVSSSWILVAMTTQRAVCILWPHRTATLHTVTTGRRLLAAVAVLALLLNGHMLYGRELRLTPTGEHLCLYVSGEYRLFFEHVWPSVDIVFSSFLPFLLILAANVVLVRRVRQSMKEAREKLTAAHPHQLHAREQKTSSMTLSVLCVSVAFLVLTTPLSIFFILQRTGGHVAVQNVQQAAVNYLVEAVGVVLWLTNNSINLFIYLLTGSRYRAALVALFPCCQRRQGS